MDLSRKSIRSSCLEMYCRKGVNRNFTKFTGKDLSRSSFCSLRPATLFKKRLWHRCCPVNFAKFLRTSFLTEHLRWLLLKYKELSELMVNMHRDVDVKIFEPANVADLNNDITKRI